MTKHRHDSHVPELCRCGHTNHYHWHYEGGCCYGPAFGEPRCECFMFEAMTLPKPG